jgi:hypothetical protein
MLRRYLGWIMLLAAVLHGFGIARSLLPAQDGIQFIRVARRFQTEPWPIVVQETDRHPLYPALLALFEPMVAALHGSGPDAWRVAAQVVSAIAAVALLVPLSLLARWLFDEQTAVLAALLFVVLPLPAELGHETLSDSVALAWFTLAFYWGARALAEGRLAMACGSALASGMGFLSRPEALILPLAVLATAALGLLPLLTAAAHKAASRTGRVLAALGSLGLPAPPAQGRGIGALVVTFLVVVGLYSGLKGDVSEKLALRWGRPYVVRHVAPRKLNHSLPKGLDNPRWDFSPKEESAAAPHLSVARAAGVWVSAWSESLVWVFAALGLWGAWRAKLRPEARWGGALAAVYLALFSAAVVVHATRFGYLSERYTLSALVVSLPWAAAGALAAAQAMQRRRGWSQSGRGLRRWIAVGALVVAGLVVQVRSAHPSRWGHWAAGRWLQTHAQPSQAVLDTRGWAALVSGLPSYDYWHIRQALSDTSLAYVVVGTDELEATSRRAATLRAILAYAAKPVAAFPERKGHSTIGVQVFRFDRPASWEGLRP